MQRFTTRSNFSTFINTTYSFPNELKCMNKLGFQRTAGGGRAKLYGKGITRSPSAGFLTENLL